MLRNSLVLALLLACAFGYTLYSDNAHNVSFEPQAEETKNKPATLPAFSFSDLKGDNYDIKEFSEKLIVLNFWATWCAPCAIEFPAMLELAQSTKNKSVFIFLSVDEDKKDIERFLKKYAPDMPSNVIIGHDKDKSISQTLFQTYKLPETYLISPGLNIREKIIGADVDWNGDEMRAKIENMK